MEINRSTGEDGFLVSPVQSNCESELLKRLGPVCALRAAQAKFSASPGVQRVLPKYLNLQLFYAIIFQLGC